MRETEPHVATLNNSAENLQLIVPNLHRRYSGVTATNRMVAPKLAQLFRAGWFGSDAPDGIARIAIQSAAQSRLRRTPLIWHARRNNEMIAGVLRRTNVRRKKQMMARASLLHHTWITRWLIRR